MLSTSTLSLQEGCYFSNTIGIDGQIGGSLSNVFHCLFNGNEIPINIVNASFVGNETVIAGNAYGLKGTASTVVATGAIFQGNENYGLELITGSKGILSNSYIADNIWGLRYNTLTTVLQSSITYIGNVMDVDADSDFLFVDGSRPLTNNWDAGSYKITAETFESDVATGTAPLTIASTTLVTNLNADLLDGKDGSAYSSTGHIHGLSSTNVVYVDTTRGLDTNDGLLLLTPFKTIQKGINTIAESIIVGESQGIVEVLGDGIYTENLLIGNGVAVLAHKATLKGEVSLGSYSRLEIGQHLPSDNNQTLISNNGVLGASYSTILMDSTNYTGINHFQNSLDASQNICKNSDRERLGLMSATFSQHTRMSGASKSWNKHSALSIILFSSHKIYLDSLISRNIQVAHTFAQSSSSCAPVAPAPCSSSAPPTPPTLHPLLGFDAVVDAPGDALHRTQAA
jgi:hypothetical protein